MVGVNVGVLALQGDYAEHLSLLAELGYGAVPVRTAHDLDRADALVIPGGESTTMLKLLERYCLRELLLKRIEQSMGVLGICAGAIMLADRANDGEPTLGAMRMEVRRNAYGRQAESFEADIEVPELEASVRGVFIRAPIITDAGETRVLATWDGNPVLVQSGCLLACTFHPELVGEPAVHRYFVEQVCGGEG